MVVGAGAGRGSAGSATPSLPDRNNSSSAVTLPANTLPNASIVAIATPTATANTTPIIQAALTSSSSSTSPWLASTVVGAVTIHATSVDVGVGSSQPHSSSSRFGMIMHDPVSPAAAATTVLSTPAITPSQKFAPTPTSHRFREYSASNNVLGYCTTSPSSNGTYL